MKMKNETGKNIGSTKRMYLFKIGWSDYGVSILVK